MSVSFKFCHYEIMINIVLRLTLKQLPHCVILASLCNKFLSNFVIPVTLCNKFKSEFVISLTLCNNFLSYFVIITLNGPGNKDWGTLRSRDQNPRHVIQEQRPIFKVKVLYFSSLEHFLSE